MGLTTNTSVIKFNVNGAERMRTTNAGNISCTGSIGCVGISTSGGALVGTYLGIANSSPLFMLHLRNCEVANSAPVFVFGKNVVGGGNRNAFIGYTNSSPIHSFLLLGIMETLIAQIH